MGIYLGSGQTAVAKDLLDGVEVGAVVEHLRGESVAQHVRTPLVDGRHHIQIFPHYSINSFRVDFVSI